MTDDRHPTQHEPADVAEVVPAVQMPLRTDVGSEITVVELVAAKSKIQDAMRAVMKKDVHFGTIPGTRKVTLYQPGAETLAQMFGLAPDLVVEDLSAPDVIRYRTIATIRHIATRACRRHGRRRGIFR